MIGLMNWLERYSKYEKKNALKPGYSTLLIHNHVVAKELSHPHVTAYDLTVMVKVASEERTELKWVESAGYNVIKIWRSPLASQSVMEAELAE